jgi:hypothetical protein
MMKKIILSLIIGLFLIGCTASKNENLAADAKVSEIKKTTASNDVSEEEEGDDECMDEDE